VLRIDAGPGIVPLRRGGGQPLFVGDRVFAFGSPFGIKFSMSQGIISGLGRSEAAPVVGGIAGYTNYIQTDAAINPGNSGGPLVDVQGRVVGVNAAIANGVNFQSEGQFQGQSAGIGFAIPIETVESVVEQLIAHEVVLRGFLGISLPIAFEFGPELVEAVRQEDGVTIDYDGSGVLVTGVSPGQPAEKAGLRKYDLILSVNDHPTPNSDVLRSLVSVQQPGDRVKVKFFRDGQIQETVVRLGAARQGRGPDNRPGLVYIEGSDTMPLDEIRRLISSQ
jgi:S1-C subfamily serine protease